MTLGTFDSIPNFSVIHSAHGGTGNRNTSAQYHLLHGQLEWRWIYLTILFKIQKLKGESLRESEFEYELKLLVFDLITLSMSKFNKVRILKFRLSIRSLNLIFFSATTAI